jgi:hypothetical protein
MLSGGVSGRIVSGDEGKDYERVGRDASVTYLNKDTICCGCVNAVVRGDGTRKGIDDDRAWFGKEDESY